MSQPDCDCVLLACDVAVRRALELASKRILGGARTGGGSGREARARVVNLPPHLWYTRLPRVCDLARQEAALREVWTCLPSELVPMIPALDSHVRELLVTGHPYDPDVMREAVSTACAASI